MPHILLVDDEPEVVNALARVLMKEHSVSKCHSAEEALTCLAENNVDLILSDIRMPVMDGIQLLTKTKDTYPTVARALLSGYSDIELCQKAIDEEISEVILTKPWDNFELKNILALILKYQRLKNENTALKTELAERT